MNLLEDAIASTAEPQAFLNTLIITNLVGITVWQQG